jgi:uncharacterized cupredoxin-like copper-binding protein
MTMRYELKVAAAAVLALTAAACSKSGDAATVSEGAPASAASAPAQLTVTAADFHFKAPRTVPAGVTTIRLVNEGPDLHHVQLVKLAAGHTVTDLTNHLVEHGEQLPEWASWVGGPNAPAPGGGVAEATLELEAGEYAMLCVIPTDGVPHLMKGMVVPLTVTPSSATAPEPVADVQVVLKDYGFDVSPALTAGKHTLRVTNSAAQPHEIFIVRLGQGKTAQDLLTWMQKPEGPPPAMPLGGATFLDRGEANYLTLDLAPGQYAFYCFVPDATDHQPHFAHGMVKQVTVE